MAVGANSPSTLESGIMLVVISQLVAKCFHDLLTYKIAGLGASGTLPRRHLHQSDDQLQRSWQQRPSLQPKQLLPRSRSRSRCQHCQPNLCRQPGSFRVRSGTTRRSANRNRPTSPPRRCRWASSGTLGSSAPRPTLSTLRPSMLRL